MRSLVLCANLLADVDAEAKYIRRAAWNNDQLVPVRDRAILSIGTCEIQHALRLARLTDLFQISGQRVSLLRRHEVREIAAYHLLDRSSDHLSAMGIDRQQRALKIMRADQAQRAFDELSIPRLTLTQRSLRHALRRHIQSRRDDEVTCPCASVSAVADHAIRCRLPSRLSH